MRFAIAFALSLWSNAVGLTAEAPPWRDIGGNPLPFETESELLEFLRVAEVVQEEDIGSGINHSKKLLLEKDGVRTYGIFREVDIRQQNARVGGRMYLEFADSHLFECAAFELAKLLGMDAVPPVVRRHIRDRDGSLQIWLPDAIDETGEDFRPPRVSEWVHQLWDVYLFDNLIFNIDRNSGNVLVDTDYRLWMIDHTRAFQSVRELLDDRIVRASRSVYERLLQLSDGEFREALESYLTASEMSALLERRDLLVARIRELVVERGEDLVLY